MITKKSLEKQGWIENTGPFFYKGRMEKKIGESTYHV